MPKIEVEIKNCKECLHFKEERYYTADSFERTHNWFCEKVGHKTIAEYVEWNEESRIKIPKWCPIIIKKGK